MKKILLGLFLSLCWISTSTVSAQFKAPTLEVYHGAECPHCHEELKWLKGVQKEHPDIEVELFEVWHNKENAVRWQTRLQELGQEPSGVPTNVIGDTVIVGFDPVALEKALGIFQRFFGHATYGNQVRRLEKNM